MKYLSVSILLFAAMCSTPKKNTSETKEEKQNLTTKVTSEKEKTIEKDNQLVVVLNNPKKIEDAKALITNSGLSWNNLELDTKGVTAGLITVPKDKKEFWLKRLTNANVFEEVQIGSKESITELKNKLANQLISIRKTPCFGDCPVYNLTINKDGKAVFEGKDYVLKKGKQEFQLSEKELETLINKIEKSDFESFADVYDNPRITDLPSTYIFCNGKFVKIRLWKNIPDNLIDVHEYATEFLYTKNFIE